MGVERKEFLDNLFRQINFVAIIDANKHGRPNDEVARDQDAIDSIQHGSDNILGSLISRQAFCLAVLINEYGKVLADRQALKEAADRLVNVSDFSQLDTIR